MKVLAKHSEFSLIHVSQGLLCLRCISSQLLYIFNEDIEARLRSTAVGFFLYIDSKCVHIKLFVFIIYYTFIHTIYSLYTKLICNYVM